METSSLLGLAGFVLACLCAAMSGAFFRPGEWYESLAKPPWRPPNWLFPPAWTLLYILIAVAGWLVWRDAPWPQALPALSLYALQLVLNAGWSAVFFGMRRPDLALIEVAFLWLAIAATTAAFFQLQTTAAWLMVPYLLWVSFAAVLNASIWRRNRAVALPARQ